MAGTTLEEVAGGEGDMEEAGRGEVVGGAAPTARAASGGGRRALAGGELRPGGCGAALAAAGARAGEGSPRALRASAAAR